MCNCPIKSWPIATGGISVSISALSITTLPPRGVSRSQFEILATTMLPPWGVSIYLSLRYWLQRCYHHKVSPLISNCFMGTTWNCATATFFCMCTNQKWARALLPNPITQKCVTSLLFMGITQNCVTTLFMSTTQKWATALLFMRITQNCVTALSFMGTTQNCVIALLFMAPLRSV